MKIENNKILFSGELNRFTADKILAKFKKEKKANINELDLKDVELIDSAGVALLDEIMHLLESNNPKIINASNIIQEAITTFTSLDLTENNPPKPDNFMLSKILLLEQSICCLIFPTGHLLDYSIKRGSVKVQ